MAVLNYVEKVQQTFPEFDKQIATRFKNGFSVRDGARHTAIISTMPVHVIENGNYVPINLNLEAGGDGYSTNHLPFKLSNDGQLIQKSGNDRIITYGVGGYSEATGYKELVKFSRDNVFISGDKALRTAPGYTLESTFFEIGIKESMWLTTLPNITEDYFVMETEAFGFTTIPKSGKLISPVLIKTILIGGGEAIDSAGNIIPLEQFLIDVPGPRILVYSGIPMSWLQTAIFPVFIDPTYSSQPDSSGKDSVSKSGTPSNNYGTAAYLQCGKSSDVNTALTKTTIEFDISSIPSSASVDDGTLSLYQYSNGATLTSATMQVTQITSSWVETSITYSSYVTLGTTGALGSLAVNPQNINTWRDISLTVSELQNYIDGVYTNYGFEVIGGSGNYTLQQFYSGDEATQTTLRPKLVINYTLLGRNFQIL